jgi:hypothetical protein
VCRIAVGDRRYSGVILDVSATGFFVQTHAKFTAQDRLTVEISVPGQGGPLRVEASVARQRIVPPQLLNVAQGGVGLRITNAPEAYFAFLGALMPDREDDPDGASARAPEGGVPLPRAAAEAAPVAPARGPGDKAFRVRVSQTGGARSRTLRCFARSAEEASARALAETGDGWRLIEACEDEEAAARGAR